MPLLLLSGPARRALPSTYRRLSQFYSTSTTSSSQPLIQITDIPAPHSGRIRILTLARPRARNAISRQLLAELRAGIDAVAAEYDTHGDEVPPAKIMGGAAGVDVKTPTRALIIASDVDTCFCAGADLKERAGFTPEETAAFLAHLRSTLSTLSQLPIPTISAVASLALGGGLELALSTHLRVFASTAQVGLPETRLGIIPGAGGTYRLPGLIGLARARDLILTGRRVSAGEAYFLGLADRLVEVLPASDDESNPEQPDPATQEQNAPDTDAHLAHLRKAKTEVLGAAVALAGEICGGAPTAVRAALQAVAWAREDVENRMYDRVVATADRNEALAAFREKRLPVFTGR